MNDTDSNGSINLSSVPAEEFDPFATDAELADDEANDTVSDAPAQQPTKIKAQAPVRKQTQTVVVPEGASGEAINADTTKSDNPPANSTGAAKTKDTEKAKQNLYEKLPVFDYAGATEDIENPDQTFDELRIAKAADFPELEDSKRVTWTVAYGKITKTVTDAKGMTIAKMKSDIETSKEFIDALKKARDKNPSCMVKPRVTAQSKGQAHASGYKGVFTNMDEVDKASKVISILPAKDGKVYEIRNTALGKFITTVIGCDLLSDVKAGFIPALGIPRIPMDLTMQIISFFRFYTNQNAVNEVLVNIYWDKESKTFAIDTPEQIVSKVSIHSSENPDYLSERYIHFMDIHSHNSMKAFFSHTDNEDEKATRLYTVIGCLDKYFPEIKTRISNGGKFHEIDPAEVFEYIDRPFPPGWAEKVTLRSAHGYIDYDSEACDCALNQYADCKGNDDTCPWNLNRNRGGGYS